MEQVEFVPSYEPSISLGDLRDGFQDKQAVVNANTYTAIFKRPEQVQRRVRYQSVEYGSKFHPVSSCSRPP